MVDDLQAALLPSSHLEPCSSDPRSGPVRTFSMEHCPWMRHDGSNSFGRMLIWQLRTRDCEAVLDQWGIKRDLLVDNGKLAKEK